MSVSPTGGTPLEVVSKGVNPVATSDGRTIVFASTEQGERAGLWKVDADGRQRMRLASSAGTVMMVTPDDQSVVFISDESGLQTPWVVSLDGGSPKQLVNVFAGGFGLDITPDGTSLLFISRDQRGQSIIIACELPGCASRRTFSALGAIRSRIRWMPGGRAFAYVDRAQSNLWARPLDGTPPYQLTHFTDRTIVDFAWSRDGTRLAISRSAGTSDIVLFKGLKR